MLNDCQFGFRRSHSTTHAVTFVETVTQTLENVSYKSTYSDTLKMTHSIPQGSTLMFILYMNVFSWCSKLLFSTLLFADDATLIIKCKKYCKCKMIFEIYN